jgi:hypothetical protein
MTMNFWPGASGCGSETISSTETTPIVSSISARSASVSET